MKTSFGKPTRRKTPTISTGKLDLKSSHLGNHPTQDFGDDTPRAASCRTSAKHWRAVGNFSPSVQVPSDSNPMEMLGPPSQEGGGIGDELTANPYLSQPGIRGMKCVRTASCELFSGGVAVWRIRFSFCVRVFYFLSLIQRTP